MSLKEKAFNSKFKELNQLITELTGKRSTKNDWKKKNKKIKLIDVENKNEKENLIQKDIIMENNIDEKKEKQEIGL